MQALFGETVFRVTKDVYFNSNTIDMKEEAENPITTELVKNNVTDAVLKNIKTKYLPLKINGIDDKEGYDTVHKARIVCRDLRVLTEKLCKKGREDATKIQKAWIQKEKEVVAEISEVEQHLKKQEDAVDAEIEARKIRAERLLKLPGRREQTKGIEVFLGKMTDDEIMGYDDNQWNQAVVSAQGRKLAEQQKAIDDAKETARMNLVAERQNSLYKIAGATMMMRHGIKTFYKGDISITEEEIATLENEAWNIRFAEIVNAKGETPKPPELNYTVHHFGKPIISEEKAIEVIGNKYEDISDDEKLFNYASALEKVEWPGLKSKEATETFNKAQEKLNEAISILRQ